jgi:hypothetical protein
VLADKAVLAAELNLAGNFTSNLGAASKSLTSFSKKFDGFSKRAYKAGQQVGTGIKNGAKIATVAIAALTTQVAAGLNQLIKLEKVTIQTNAVLTSTKHAAGLSGKEIRALAEEYENLNATMDDKVIQSGENVLLTFTNIGKKAFKPALEAALNLNEALGGGEGGLQKTIIQVGKALNDPTKGFTALRRVGVSFTADQEKLIKKLQKEGDLFGAQQVILKELSKEFGGSFVKAGKSTEATIAGIGDAVEDLQKALATALFPTIKKVLPTLREFLTSPQFVKGVEDLGKGIASLFSDENIKAGTDALKGAFALAKEAAPVVVSAAKTAVGVLKVAADIFKSLPPEIQALAISGLAINKLTGGLVTNLAGGLIGAVLKQLVSGVVNVTGGVVNVAGGVGVGGVPGVGGVSTSEASGFAKTFKELLKLAILPAIAITIGEAINQATNADASLTTTAARHQEAVTRGGSQGGRSGAVIPVRVVNQPTRDASALAAAARRAFPTPQNTENPDRTEERIARLATQQVAEIKRLNAISRRGGARADKANAKLDRIASRANLTTSAVKALGGRVSSVKNAINRKKLSVTVNNRNQVFINGRLFQGGVTRYVKSNVGAGINP